MFQIITHRRLSFSAGFTTPLIMGALLAVSIVFTAPSPATGQDFSPRLDQPYLPARAFVPTLPQIPTLAEAAYKMEMCHDSIRWYEWVKSFNLPLAEFGTARCLERLGRYDAALERLDRLRAQDNRYSDQVSTLRGHLLLLLTEQAQLRGNLEQSERYLRTFFSEHRNQRNHDRYAYLMRQQATLANLQQGRSNPDFDQPLRVGLLLPLSGTMAPVGTSMEKAALLALYKQALPQLEVYPEDTKGTPDGTLAAFERALQSGVDIIMGPLLGNNVKAVARYADSANVPLLAFSSDTQALVEDEVRLFSILPTEQARLMARYGVEQKGLRTFSALLPDNRYGRVMLEAFRDELERLGGTFDRHAFFTPGSADLNGPIRYLTRMAEAEKTLNDELEELEKVYELLASAMDDEDLQRLEELRKAEAQPIVQYQGLFIPASADAMPLISSQLAFYDSDGSQLQLLGSAQWDNTGLLAESQNYLANAIYPTTPNTEQKEFNSNFLGTYGSTPHPLAKLAYDSTNLIAHLTRQGLRRGENLEGKLLRLKAFHGATGPYQILRNGTLRHGYSLMRVRHRYGQSRAVEVSAPPYLLPPENAPLGGIRTESKRSLTPQDSRRRGGFFGGIFGN